MLQFIRDKSQGIIAFVIIGLIALTFALWGIHNYFNGSSKSAPVATVNGHKISQQSFSMAYQRLRQGLIQKEPELFQSQTSVNALKKQLVDSMINNTLLLQFASDNGFGVGQNLLELSLAQMPAFQVNGQFSKFKFEQFLSSQMYSQTSFFSSLKTNILLAQLKSGFESTSFALPYQVSENIKLINEGRTFDYAEIPTSLFSSKIKVSKKQIEAYYKAHASEFTVPLKVSASYIELNLKNLSAKIKPTTTELKTYYQDNINHYTTPKKWHVAHILIAVTKEQGKKAEQAAYKKAEMIEKEIKDGKSFSSLAKKYSEDLSTASKGGEMPWVTFYQISKTWQNQLYALKKVGDVSPVFQTSAGYEIVKLLGTKAAVVQSYKSVASKVKKDYILQQAEKKFASYTDDLANLTFEHPNSLEPAAKQLGLTIHTTKYFPKTGGKKGMAKNQRFVQAAFTSSVLNQGNNSNTVNLSDSEVVVLRIDHKQPSYVKKLSEVKSTIVKALKAKQESAMAKALAEKIQKDVVAGKSLSTEAKANKLSYHAVTKAVMRHKHGKLSDELVSKAFHLQVPSKTQASVGITKMPHGGYALVQLTGVSHNTISSSDLTKMKTFYKEGTASAQGNVQYYLFTQHLKKSAKIKVSKTTTK